MKINLAHGRAVSSCVLGLLLGMISVLTLSAADTSSSVLATNANATASAADASAHSPLPAPLPDMGVGASVFRMLGALTMVMGLFFAGVWLFRRWQVLQAGRSGQNHLHVLEVKSMGARQTLYVVGYDRQRMLLASSPTGVQLISHLPEAEQDAGRENVPLPSTFAAALHSVVSRKP